MKEKYFSLLESFKGKKILVLGDIMLDKYVFGKVSRVSPEAPVPIIKVDKENYVPGGAANAANNISSLGGEAFLVGVVGDDQERSTLLNELRARNIKTEGIVIDGTKPTIQKIRVLSQNQQLIRIDYEKDSNSSSDIQNELINTLQRLVRESDIVIVSDYAKGMVTKEVMEKLKEAANSEGKKIIIDPRPQNKDLYAGSYLITPNNKEACQMAKKYIDTEEEFESLGRGLGNELNSNIIITRGSKGMAIFQKDNGTLNIPTKAKEVYDVSGAGDTVVAALSLALASGASLEEAAGLANYAAGVVVGKIGTATCTLDEIKQSIEDDTE